jgi:hypothetical protein
MSTYYYLACDDCRELARFATSSASGIGMMNAADALPFFAVAHAKHHTRIVDEHQCEEYELIESMTDEEVWKVVAR